jgi:hypothetical protein
LGTGLVGALAARSCTSRETSALQEQWSDGISSGSHDFFSPGEGFQMQLVHSACGFQIEVDSLKHAMRLIFVEQGTDFIYPNLKGKQR